MDEFSSSTTKFAIVELGQPLKYQNLSQIPTDYTIVVLMILHVVSLDGGRHLERRLQNLQDK